MGASCSCEPRPRAAGSDTEAGHEASELVNATSVLPPASTDDAPSPNERDANPATVLTQLNDSAASADSVASPTTTSPASPVPTGRRGKPQQTMSARSFTSVVVDSFERPPTVSDTSREDGTSSINEVSALFEALSSPAPTSPDKAQPRKKRRLSTLVLRGGGASYRGIKRPMLYQPTDVKAGGEHTYSTDDDGEATPVRCRPEDTASTTSRSSVDSASSTRKDRRVVQFVGHYREEQ